MVNQEIYFSDRYKIAYNSALEFPEALTIEAQQPNSISSVIFKDSELSDVHVVVGKTGAGKTNIFQLIGMPEEERISNSGQGASYFLLYEADNYFVIEPFDIPINSSVIPHLSSPENEKRMAEELARMSASVQEYMRILDSMTMYRFEIKDCKPINVRHIIHPDDLGKDMTFIFNGYERHAFPFCPYDEVRFETVDSNTKWQTRINAEYHRTALWNSCRFLKEYIDSFDEENIKRKAALVIKCQNWSGTIKQHIDDRIKAHDYWTFIERNRQDDEDRALGRKVKKRKPIAIRHQFVHDLWTDFALYLREFISFILMYPNETPDTALDYSGIKDVFLEALDYSYEKQLEKCEGATGRREKNPIDPTVLPDFEDISILKRLEWLSMWIDRRGDGNPHYLLWQIYGDIKDIGEILGKFDDKYFTNDTFTLPVEDMYIEENRELVGDLFERMEQYRPDDSGIFTKELLPYRFSCISSGEYQYAKVMGGIEEFCVKLSSGEYGNHPNLIYLLDEPETYMHPELCRTFLKRLDSVLKERTGNSDLQILISTHSPLLLSDLLPEQITRLDVDSRGYCVIKNGTDKAYFGANIHTILADGFFLDYTIGEYARVFLQEKLDWLKELSGRDSLTAEEKYAVQELKKAVPFIGDTLIRNCFKMLLEQPGVNDD
ncbi:MAG: AAA family ATPase [Acutalibacteraceae bacterium]